MSNESIGEILGNNAQQRLISFVERTERLIEERDGISEDIKEVLSEAKGEGFDVKTLRKAIALRRIDPAKRQEAEALLDTYMTALGGL